MTEDKNKIIGDTKKVQRQIEDLGPFKGLYPLIFKKYGYILYIFIILLLFINTILILNM